MVAINDVVTKTGDDGKTCLANQQRVDKTDPRIELIGCIDELNAHCGLASSLLHEVGNFAELKSQLLRIQNELFNLGCEIAVLAEDQREDTPHIIENNILQLEKEICAHNADLPALTSFVLPGGSQLCAELHITRTVCRRAERRFLLVAQQSELSDTAQRYLNRLSDWLFIAARFALKQENHLEKLWQPQKKDAGDE